MDQTRALVLINFFVSTAPPCSVRRPENKYTQHLSGESDRKYRTSCGGSGTGCCPPVGQSQRWSLGLSSTPSGLHTVNTHTFTPSEQTWTPWTNCPFMFTLSCDLHNLKSQIEKCVKETPQNITKMLLCSLEVDFVVK